MRIINTNLIKEEVKRLFIDANYVLPEDLSLTIAEAEKSETNPLAKNVLMKLRENAEVAKNINVPICQDTGLAVVFLEIGQEVFLEGALYEDAINEGIRLAYEEGYLRKSVVNDPLFTRTNTNDNTPAVIHTRIVGGDKIKITAAPKGFGSENMSAVKMFTPSATKDSIIAFTVETVKTAGSNPCPPIVIGIGLGGSFEYCTLLSKKALCRPVSIRNRNSLYAALEQEILEAVNNTGIGPQGFGGKTTALAVNIEYFPTHIAGLPCAINIGCHVTRHKSALI